MLKIIGGSYGTSGNVKISGEDILIKGVYDTQRSFFDIEKINFKEEKETNFSIFYLLFFFIFLTIIPWFLFGPIVGILGLILTIVLSFYKKKSNILEVVFNDNEKLVTTGSKSEIKTIMANYRQAKEHFKNKE